FQYLKTDSKTASELRDDKKSTKKGIGAFLKKLRKNKTDDKKQNKIREPDKLTKPKAGILKTGDQEVRKPIYVNTVPHVKFQDSVVENKETGDSSWIPDLKKNPLYVSANGTEFANSKEENLYDEIPEEPFYGNVGF
ncbi:hypothetical protein MHBO_003380, partial [Bonamia ostreae]